jgi:hypothetical protein
VRADKIKATSVDNLAGFASCLIDSLGASWQKILVDCKGYLQSLKRTIRLYIKIRPFAMLSS